MIITVLILLNYFQTAPLKMYISFKERKCPLCFQSDIEIPERLLHFLSLYKKQCTKFRQEQKDKSYFLLLSGNYQAAFTSLSKVQRQPGMQTLESSVTFLIQLCSSHTILRPVQPLPRQLGKSISPLLRKVQKINFGDIGHLLKCLAQ